MTNPDLEALIAEARDFGGSWADAEYLFHRLADALERERSKNARLVEALRDCIHALMSSDDDVQWSAQDAARKALDGTDE